MAIVSGDKIARWSASYCLIAVLRVVTAYPWSGCPISGIRVVVVIRIESMSVCVSVIIVYVARVFLLFVLLHWFMVLFCVRSWIAVVVVLPVGS